LPLLNWNSVELSLVWAVLPINTVNPLASTAREFYIRLYNLSSDNDPVPQTLFTKY
jgi:hypothetical protein